jgi:hypothetical protein
MSRGRPRPEERGARSGIPTRGHVAAVSLQDAWGDVPGFAGLTCIPICDGVVVYWRGEPPEQLRLDVAAARREGVEVDLVPAAFTAQELRAEADRLSTAHVDAFPRIKVIGARFDGSGIDVEVAAGTLAEAERLGVDLSDLFSRRYPVTVLGEADPRVSDVR